MKTFCYVLLTILITFAKANTASIFKLSSYSPQNISLSWDEFKANLSSYLPEKPKNYFIALGESHLNQVLTYELYNDLFDILKTHNIIKKFNFCVEPISGGIAESFFFNFLTQQAKKVTYFEQSPSQTNFTTCRVRGIKNYFFYSGFHHQLPLAKIFPDNFIATKVSTSWEQSIYSQAQSKGLSMGWIDLLAIENDSLNIIFKNKPSNFLQYQDILKNWINDEEQFQQQLKPIHQNKNSFANLLLSVIPMKVNAGPQYKGGQHFFIITSTKKELTYNAALLKKILSLNQDEQNALYKNLFSAQKIRYTRFHFSTIDDNNSMNCNISGIDTKIHCSSQVLSWVDEQNNRRILLWSPNNESLRCLDSEKELALSECM